MEHNKDIGKAIREKLESLDRAPHNDLWQSIEADLPKKRRRRILPFWLMFVSVAVIALLLYVVTDGFSDAEFWNPDYEQPQQNPVGADSNDDEKNNVSGENPESDNAAGTDGTIGINNAHESQSSGNGSVVGNTTSGENASEANGNGQSRKAKNNRLKGNISDDGTTSVGKKSPKKASSKWENSRYASSKNKAGSKKSKRKNGRNGSANSAVASGMLTDSDVSGTNDGKLAKQTGEGNQNGITGNPVPSGTGTSGSNIGGQSKPTNTAETHLAQTDSIAKAIVEKEKKKKEKDKDTTKTEELEAPNYKTFSVFLYAAPTYYDNFSNTSSIDSRLDSLSTIRSEITYNYGGYLGFKYDDKWSVRVGVARTDLKRTTTGIPVSSLINTQNYYNLQYADGVSNEVIAGQFGEENRFDIVQETSYLEFPIELKYKLFDRKISVEGIGGVSTLFQRDNTVTAESGNSGSILMGSTRSMYKTYFSANLGVGFSYKITDDLRFNVEPVFKYHLRTASVALQPYTISVLAGLEYTFNLNTNKKTRAKGERSEAKKQAKK